MWKLYRDKGTGKFLCSNGEWTSDMSLACNFLDNEQDEQEQLLDKARGAREVEWLYAFDVARATKYDFTVEIPSLVHPLGPRAESPASDHRASASA
jgi:hypothetical protein